MTEQIKIASVSQMIELAKSKYPVSIPYKGKLTEEDITELERVCDVRCSSIYMDGSGYYFIRYRKDKEVEKELMNDRAD